MAYLPLEDYGVIGDMHTVALVGMNGSIDWFCFPSFDSPSVFAAVLDDEKGGRYKIEPTCGVATHKQLYWPGTNVLITRFLSSDGVGEIRDLMPVDRRNTYGTTHQVVRQVTAVRGIMPFRLECRPAFNYGRDSHRTVLKPEGAEFHSTGLSLELTSAVPLTIEDDGVVAEFSLEEGQSTVFVLGRSDPTTPASLSIEADEATEAFQRTVDYWRHWLSGCRYTGRWREMVERSALMLKLLTYQPTGAIVAAPTCSLPEGIGGVRNWDYRYTWIRDATFTLYAFMRLGFTDEAEQFMEWLEARARELGPGGSLQVMYGIDGRHELEEETLDHLEGYRGSRPVRIGNAAYNQLQLDIYGELLDAVYLYNKYGSPISYELWSHVVELTDWVTQNWQRRDEGVWEVRAGRRQFVYSKVMCWVALDRAIRLADERSLPADRQRWLETRDQIYHTIMEKGWSDRRQSFVQHYESEALDAANLIMPLVHFLSPTDERLLSTLDATLRSPTHGGLVSNSLVYRYNIGETADGLSGEEGTFNICTFWLVEALARAGRRDRRRLEAARYLFEQMLGYANHVGLYAEETGPCGEALGNFPQAFTHLGLISAAYSLDRALGEKD